jgi:hypothetical protein
VGLLKHLLFWPVTGPAFLTRFSLEKVEGAVRTELTDDSSVKQDLMELQMQLELGDIDDDEYVAREAELMAGSVTSAAGARSSAWPRPAGWCASPRGRTTRRADEEPARGEDRTPQVAASDEAQVDISFGFDED